MKNTPLASTVLAVAIAFVNSPAWAIDQEATIDTTAADTPFRVVRLGDNQMTCEALIAEMDDLNGRLQAQSDAMNERSAALSRAAMRASRGAGGGMAQGLGLSLGSLAANFIPGGAFVAAAAQTVASTAAQAQAQAQQERMMQDMQAAADGMTDGVGDLAPITQRIQHLGEITRDKGC